MSEFAVELTDTETVTEEGEFLIDNLGKIIAAVCSLAIIGGIILWLSFTKKSSAGKYEVTEPEKPEPVKLVVKPVIRVEDVEIKLKR